MLAKHTVSISEALHHVFIRPLSISAQLPLLSNAPSSRAILRQRRFPLASTRSYANKYKPPTGQIYNELIRSNTGLIELIDDDGQMRSRQRLKTVLNSFERKRFRLVQVAPADARGAKGYPICKIISTNEKFASDISRKHTRSDPLDSSKKLEINWSAEPKDLDHRLNVLTKFLEEGRAVEIELMVNKSGREVSQPEREKMVDSIVTTATSVGGVQKWKPTEGDVTRRMRLYFIKKGGAEAGSAKSIAEDRQSRVSERKAMKMEKAKEVEARRLQAAEKERKKLAEYEERKAEERAKVEELRRRETEARM